MQNFIGMISQYLGKQKESIKQYQFMIRPCLILAAVYTVAISALLRANYSYRDDLRRAVCGRKGWDNYGRYLSNFLSSIIHADDYLTDVSPLPQLLAVLIMAASGIIIWYSVSEKRKISVWDLVALIPLGLSPYFLACISFKYDSPYMALSILASVAPILYDKHSSIQYILIVTIGTLVMCTTYQASSGIFPMLTILLSVKRWNNKENTKTIFKFLSNSVLGYFAGLIIFKLFLMPPPKTQYVSSTLPPIGKLIPETIKHLLKYFVIIKEDFKVEWLVLICLMMAAFLSVMVRDSQRNKLVAACGAGMALLAMLFFSFGMYPILSKPLFNPRAMYGFGVFITLVGIVLSTSNKIYSGKFVCILLTWCFFVFSFTYGNALKIQENYSEFRMEALLDDLKDIDIMVSKNKNQPMRIQFEGTIGYAPAVQHMSKEAEVLKQLMPAKSSWTNGVYKFFHYYKVKNVIWNLPTKSGLDLTTHKLPVLKDNMFHTIRGKDQYILIEMK